jgi:hypothetical protein
LLQSPLLNLAVDPLVLRSLDIAVIGAEVFMGGASAWAIGCLVALLVFWCLPLLDEALSMLVVGWLFRGPDLRPLGMSL